MASWQYATVTWNQHRRKADDDPDRPWVCAAYFRIVGQSDFETLVDNVPDTGKTQQVVGMAVARAGREGWELISITTRSAAMREEPGVTWTSAIELNASTGSNDRYPDTGLGSLAAQYHDARLVRQPDVDRSRPPASRATPRPEQRPVIVACGLHAHSGQPGHASGRGVRPTPEPAIRLDVRNGRHSLARALLEDLLIRPCRSAWAITKRSCPG